MNRYKNCTMMAFAVIVTGLSMGCAGPARPEGLGTAISVASPNPIVVPATSPTPAAAPTPTAGPTQAPPPTPTSEPKPSPTAGARLPTSPQTVDRGSGEPAHDFQLTLLDGKSLRLSDLRGNVVVLNFWASWCAPCIQEMPDFEEMWREFKDRGVVFLGVAVSDVEEDSQAFADALGVTYQLGLDTTGEITREYRVTSLPTTLLIDRQGNQARRFGVANKGALRIFLNGQLGGQ